MIPSTIDIVNARHHNLKNITISIPKNKLVVITGPSGSGKSTLAIDTLYAEGQRKYLESLSSYVRQFLDQYQPPEVESISGLSPSIAIDQTISSSNPRSTVGTVTEIYNFLKVLFARVGTLHCPTSGEQIRSHSPTQIVEEILTNPHGTKIEILSPIVCESLHSVQRILSLGFSRAYHNNKQILLDELSEFANSINIDLIIDRVILKESIQTRLMESIECSLKMGEGFTSIIYPNTTKYYSELNLSLATGKTYPKLEPNLFSFNSAIGACQKCDGLGITKVFSTSKIIPDLNISVNDGAITPFRHRKSFFYKMFLNVLKTENISTSKKLSTFSDDELNLILNGSSKSYNYSFSSENSKFEFSGTFEGIIGWLNKKHSKITSTQKRTELEYFMNISQCHECDGQRLSEVGRNTFINKKNIFELSMMPLDNLQLFLSKIIFDDERNIPAQKLLSEINSRLKCLLDLGLKYLSLNRPANTLSGGEAQRIKLATQLGTALSGILYILDEPSIGLHPRDNSKLLQILCHLRDLGNSVIVVEHDRDAISCADYIIDMGPAAGISGGEIIFHGQLESLLNCKKSLTAKHLNNKNIIKIPARKKPTSHITITGITKNNLHNLDVQIPKCVFTCVTGVSGSGKSTLINQVLAQASRLIINSSIRVAKSISFLRSISGIDDYNKVIILDQSPIGKNSKSNPSTYTGIFDEIRSVFSKVADSRIRGFKPGRFSFNVKGGRCEECEGFGQKRIEMQFLPDVFVTCDSCKGKRYNSDTLNILYKGYSIADVLNLTVEEALNVFQNYPKINRTLSMINKLGLGYLMLGQPAPTLSGGESQRLKLASELSKRIQGNALYLLDEPTTGLHFHDIELLLKALYGLRDDGHTVIVIEHNLDVIKCADYIIDMGPEGGEGGGTIVSCGTPEEVSKNINSHTGNYLRELL